MKSTAALLLSATLIALSGCSSMKVSTQCANQFDFTPASSYQWVDAPEAMLKEDDSFLHPAVKRALNNELASRNMQETLKPKEHMLQVAYVVKLSELESYTSNSPDEERLSGGIVFNTKNKNWNLKEQHPDLNVYLTEQADFILLIFDPASGKRVWRGSLKTKFSRAVPIEQQQEQLQLIARKLLRDFPKSRH